MTDGPGSKAPWQTGLDRAQQAVARGQSQPEPLPLPPVPVVQSTGDWKLDRRLARHLAKQQKQAIEDHYRSPLEGWVMLAAAGGLAVMAMLHGADMWWLLFPAMGIGTGGARIIGKRTWQAGAPPAPVLTPAPPETPRPLPVKAAPEVDPRDERVDAICDKILKEVERGSKVVTELIRDPKETVKTLRLTCRELTRRERELRTLTTPEDEARLAAERTGLTERIAAEKDDVVRQRLASALQALDDSAQAARGDHRRRQAVRCRAHPHQLCHGEPVHADHPLAVGGFRVGRCRRGGSPKQPGRPGPAHERRGRCPGSREPGRALPGDRRCLSGGGVELEHAPAHPLIRAPCSVGS